MEVPDPGDEVGGPGVAPTRVSTPVVRATGLGNGFALSEDGRTRLHLKLDAGAGFDTNPYSVPLESEGFAGDVVARIRPGLALDYPGSLISFDTDVFVDYGFLAGAIDEETRNPLLYQSALRAALEINRGGMFSFALQEGLSWNNDPAFVTLGSTFNRLRNNLTAGIGFRPGGGTLRFRLTYDFGFEKWFNLFGTPSELVEQGVFDQMSHLAVLRTDWKFLPRTGMFLLLTGGIHTYPFSDVNPTSFPVGALFGIMGQFTPKLSGLLSIGYQNPLIFDDGAIQTATFIGAGGQAELRWALAPTTRLGAGFQRSSTPAPLYQYVTNNRFYLRFEQAIGGKMLLAANAGYSILEFGQEQISLTNVSSRLDGQLDGRLDLAYYLTDWLSFGITNELNWRVSNADEVDSNINLGFFRNETLLLLSLHY